MTPESSAIAGAFPRAALVHDWLTVPGGSEQVVLALLDLLGADAELFTSVYDPAPWPPAIRDRTVHTSFLDRLPGARTRYPKLLPLMNAAFESFDLTDFDLVLSSSHSCAKNVLTGPGTRHVCYCHTPMRHAWEPGFLRDEGLGRVSRLAAAALVGRLRRQDVTGALRPDIFVANSTHVARRIEKYYRRDAQIVHPPVAVDAYLSQERRPDDYYLVLGRIVPYKRVDLALSACATLGRRVKVVGAGRAMDAARGAAGPGAEFLGHVPSDELRDVLAGARALLFCGTEDFGIVPVEAQAAGVPVIAYGRGGALDTVVPGETGLFHDSQTPAAVASAILELEELSFDEETIRANARRFGVERFRSEMARIVLDRADVGAPA